MIYLRRVLGYVKPQLPMAILAVFCGFLAAGLLAINVAAMLPLMRVMIEDEGLDGWVNRAIVKDRSGIDFFPQHITDQTDLAAAKVGLRVKGIELRSVAESAGVKPADLALSISWGESSDISAQAALLAQLAEAPSAVPLTLTIKRSDGPVETVVFEMDPPPFYKPIANWFLGFVPDGQGAEFKRNCIVLMIVLMVVATLARCGFRFVQEYLVCRISFRSITQLRMDAYKNTIRLPLSHFSSQGVSDTASRFIQDTVCINAGISMVFGKLIREPFTMLFLVAGALIINAQMTLIVMTGAPLAAWVISKLGRKMKQATRRSLESWSGVLARLQESLLGIRVVKGYHREDHEYQEFLAVNNQLLRQQFRMAKIEAASGPMLESLGMLAASVGMVFAAYWMTEGNMAISDFFTLLILLATMAESGRKLGDVYPRLQVSNAAAERVYHLIDTPAESDPPAAVELPRLSRELEFRDINFTYPASPTPTLCDINLKVDAYQTIAIVGPNGSGKTTLLSLIPRFFLPDSGSILIDGQAIAAASLSSLRSQIGIVTQQTVIFNTTIAANIAYGRLDATEQEIISAAKRAYVHEFIEQTENGYQTIVGEQGMTLSGGQLQRLAIARAILRDPAILIFDEAMSQIDSDSEVKIQKAIDEFSRDRTSFIIAHRLSTVINTDRIIVLDRGAIVADGTHQQLLDGCDLYRQLYQMQFAASPAGD